MPSHWAPVSSHPPAHIILRTESLYFSATCFAKCPAKALVSASCSSIIAENPLQHNGALVEFSASKFNRWLTAKMSKHLSAKGGSPPPLFSPSLFTHAVYPSPFSLSLFTHPLIHSLSISSLFDGSICYTMSGGGAKQHHPPTHILSFTFSFTFTLTLSFTLTLGFQLRNQWFLIAEPMVFLYRTKRNRRFCIKITKSKQWFFHRGKQNNRWFSREKRNRTIGFSCGNLWFSTFEPPVMLFLLQSYPQALSVVHKVSTDYSQIIHRIFSLLLLFSHNKTASPQIYTGWLLLFRFSFLLVEVRYSALVYAWRCLRSTRTSSFMSIGLATWAFMPWARHF